MGVTYRYAPDVKRIAEEIIVAEHLHLRGEPLRYIFRSEATKKGGKIILGTASIVQGRTAFLAEADPEEPPDPTAVDPVPEPESFFLVEIAADMWDQLSHRQRRALVDHELSHCTVEINDKGMPVKKLVAHDVEEFLGVIERHGLWQRGLKDFGKRCAEQLELELDSALRGDAAAREMAKARDTLADAAEAAEDENLRAAAATGDDGDAADQDEDEGPQDEE